MEGFILDNIKEKKSEMSVKKLKIDARMMNMLPDILNLAQKAGAVAKRLKIHIRCCMH